LPFPYCNKVYEERMRMGIGAAQSDGIEGITFGDLFLIDLRQYRKRVVETENFIVSLLAAQC
jgi:hypothetical protein